MRAQCDMSAGVSHADGEGFSHDDCGIARLDGRSVFLSGAPPGEEVSLSMFPHVIHMESMAVFTREDAVS